MKAPRGQLISKVKSTTTNNGTRLHPMDKYQSLKASSIVIFDATLHLTLIAIKIEL